ncbi:MAG: hypothetical protein Q8L68_03000, partial [Methylococcales bacterium]|nr:hypothetical protein [Methylococcales bacterium]
VEKLNQSTEIYKNCAEAVQTESAELFVLRKQSSEEVIATVEAYINTLANTPKEFDRSFAEYKAEFRIFTGMLHDLQAKSDDVNFQFGTTATAGILAGVGTAAFAPTVAMAIATTFGTASTGTAIATLSGAAATNAALAWLGGGTLAAGAGGMAAGEALLLLAGPVGWTIVGATVVGGGLLARKQNEKIANEANTKRKEIEILTAQLRAAEHEIKRIISLTKLHVTGVKEILFKLLNSAPENYLSFTSEEKNELAALINHIQSLSKLLNEKVVISEPLTPAQKEQAMIDEFLHSNYTVKYK